MKTKNKYKFLRTGLKSQHGKIKWKIGVWKKEKNIDICNRGFHASDTPLQALSYVKGEIIAEVEVRGNSIIEDDKGCWEEMRIVRAWKWTKLDSVELSIFAAEQVIGIFEKYDKKDNRPRKAIEAAKECVKVLRSGNKKASYAAYAARAARAAYAAYAARAARASNAAYAAAYAAYAASNAAYAASNAAYAAGYAAYAAGYKKMTKKLDKWFLDRIKTLEEIV